MSEVHISEKLRFIGRYILPPILVVIVVFLVIIWLFPTSSLTLEVFTLIYWSLSIVSFPLNYQVKRWTDYVVDHYGQQREKNPTMRKMYATKDFRERKVGLIGMCAALLAFYIFGIITRIFLPFLHFPPLLPLLLPSCFLAVVLYDFLSDFYALKIDLKPNHEA